MQCSGRESAIQYMNMMARAIRVVTDYPAKYKDLSSQMGIEEITKKVNDILNREFRQEEVCFFQVVESLLRTVEDVNNPDRFLMARAIALWLDAHITYETDDGINTYSIGSIVPYTSESLVILDSLNDNIDNTHIYIMPYMSTVECIMKNDKDPDNPIKKDLHMHEVLWEMNDDLHNCRYRIDRENIVVNHVILPWHTKELKHPGFFRVAFSPITRESDLLNGDEIIVSDSSGEHRKCQYEEPKKSDYLEERFKNVLKYATKKELAIDLLFGPEMLGTSYMYQENNAYIEDALQECGEDEDNKPKIIILPSRTTLRHNFCYVYDSYGTKLGEQHKMFPFKNMRDHSDEALDNNGIIRYLVIHIPDFERIVILICKDFLEEDDQLRELIYKQINPTLVIVPSYTIGETDFIETLASVKKYGTSVVWGTCCGAPRAESAYIGAASMIRMDLVPKMSDVCKCDRHCEKYKSCIFYIDLPLVIHDREKIDIQFVHELIS